MLRDPSALLFRVAVGALAVVLYRALPFVLWAVVSRRVRPSTKLVSVGALGIGVLGVKQLGLDVREIVLRAPVMLGYFALLALLVHQLRPVGRRILGKWFLVLLLPGLYLAVPAIVGGPVTIAVILVVGWEMGLAAFSYAVSARDSSRKDALFFLLVDPSLVYADRARWEPQSKARDVSRGSLRTLRGAVQLAGQELVAAAIVLVPFLMPVDLLAVRDGPTYAGFLGSHLAFGASIYLAHAGLASAQIGLLRIAGFRAMERYQHPYLASGPSDFWSRWNRWLGRWAKRYLYLPLAGAAARRLDGQTRRIVIGAAAMVTFLVIGLLHDLLPWMAGLAGGRVGYPFSMTWVFAGAGAMLVGWHFLARTRPLVAARARLPAWVSASVRRLVFLQLIVLWLWLAIPAVTARRLPSSLLPDTQAHRPPITAAARHSR